jgi:hypothetical protein
LVEVPGPGFWTRTCVEDLERATVELEMLLFSSGVTQAAQTALPSIRKAPPRSNSAPPIRMKQRLQ